VHIRNGFILFILLVPALAEPAKPPPPMPTEPAGSADLYELGSELFDQLTSPEIKAQFEMPTKVQWDEFAARLQSALDDNRLDELARYEPQARVALAALQAFPEYGDYTDWLTERLDYIEAVKQVVKAPPISPTSPTGPAIPHYELWRQRLQGRPVPAGAAALLPVLRGIFSTAGLPPELAWLAEVESAFNPKARSPAGASGLFQLMPATARALGLSAFLPDDRTNPEKNAYAAAKYLRELYAQFNDWPLALAAYNAGPGRVRRALDQAGAKTYGDIAVILPAETRMYVPKVLATLALRANLLPAQLLAPR
jgi:membrane-bound lytic murein transglycosylase D